MKNLKELFSKDELVLFTSKGCGYCKQVKDALKKEKIEYVEKDISKYNRQWNELVQLTNLPVTPAAVYLGRNLFPGRDFPNAQHLISILKQYKKTNIDKNEAVVERLATLGYNISQAFSRLDGRLSKIEQQLKNEKDEHKSTD